MPDKPILIVVEVAGISSGFQITPPKTVSLVIGLEVLMPKFPVLPSNIRAEGDEVAKEVGEVVPT